jgi:hypothetical protein
LAPVPRIDGISISFDPFVILLSCAIAPPSRCDIGLQAVVELRRNAEAELRDGRADGSQIDPARVIHRLQIEPIVTRDCLQHEIAASSTVRAMGPQ